MKIAVVDHSTQFASRPGSLERICEAVSAQLSGEVSREWGSKEECWVRPFAPTCKLPSDVYPMGVFDDADQAGALGYHDVGPDGKPYGKVFAGTVMRYGGTIDGAGNSVSVTLSHEACETFGDRGANDWSMMPDGRLTAKELCDAVEGDSYQNVRNGPYLSNFLLPNWFRPADGEVKRYDHMGNLDHPFSMTKGGYMILMAGGKVGQSFGAEFPEWKREQKDHAAARTARRLRSGKDAK